MEKEQEKRTDVGFATVNLVVDVFKQLNEPFFLCEITNFISFFFLSPIFELQKKKKKNDLQTNWLWNSEHVSI